MGSQPPPQSLKINPYAATSPNSFPKPEPVVIELQADDLVDAGSTRPIQVASLHNPGMAAPFTPPPPRPEPILPPATPAPGFATMQSVAWQQTPPQDYPQVQSQAYPQQSQYPQAQSQYPQAQQPAMHPSYAPTAMDIAMQQAYATPPPKKSRTGLVLGIVGGLGFLFLLGLGGAGFAYYKLRMEVDETVQAAAVQTDPTPATTTTTASTSASDVKKTNAFDPPPLATSDTKIDKAAPPPIVTNTTKPATTSNTSSTWKPAATPKVSAKTEPKTEPKVDVKKDDAKVDAKADAPKTDEGAAGGGTGTVRSFNAEAGKPIMVDGNMGGVAPAPFTVTCGPHKIQVGSGPVKNVNVPCNGAVTVGSPDGT